MKTKQLISAGALTLVALTSTSTQAASCNGTLVGTTCTLEGTNVRWVYDVSSQATAMLLFGAPTLVGDSVRFLPTSFRAESQNGAVVTGTGSGNTATATAYFVFDHVINKNGGEILGVSALDFGDYAITGGDRVHADLYLNSSSNVDATQFGQTVNSFDTNVATGGTATLWSLPDSINIGALTSLLTGQHVFSGDVTLGVQDTLTATTLTGAVQDAWIQKKIQLDAVVPVPASAWLFGSALGLLGLRRRKS